MTNQPSLTVAVLTYQRNDDLRAIVPQLLAQLDELEPGHPADLLVVDNDAAAGGRAVIASIPDDRMRYVVEPEPGIAAARNRALDECVDRDLLVFIDDDERPTAGWLRRLLGTRAATGAAAVGGPVRSEFDGRPDPWIEAGGFFGRRHRLQLETGSTIPVAATNNLLLDLRAVREHGLRFATDVRMAGGEDNLFTRNLSKAGGRIVWCADALVLERVPADRATRRWVLTRSLSSGNVLARVKLRMAPSVGQSLRIRLSLILGGVARIAGGSMRCGLGWLSRSLTHEARGARAVSRGLGMVLGAAGYSYQAYRRKGGEPPADRRQAA